MLERMHKHVARAEVRRRWFSSEPLGFGRGEVPDQVVLEPSCCRTIPNVWLDGLTGITGRGLGRRPWRRAARSDPGGAARASSCRAHPGRRPVSQGYSGAWKLEREVQPMGFRGAIFDVDGVLVDSPHERAWRQALRELMEGEWCDLRPRTTYTPGRFTREVYQAVVAGKPRLDGARAALEYFGVPDAAERAHAYGERKQQILERLIDAGEFHAFPDALGFALAVRQAGCLLAAASSSKNAHQFLARIRLDVFARERGLPYGFVRDGLSLEDLFDADLSGRDVPRGKPDPMIFLLSARELGLEPRECFVVEDAASGVQAAKAGGMAALGVARLHDQALLEEAGADLVVTSLDQVAVNALAQGRLRRASVR